MPVAGVPGAHPESWYGVADNLRYDMAPFNYNPVPISASLDSLAWSM